MGFVWRGLERIGIGNPWGWSGSGLDWRGFVSVLEKFEGNGRSWAGEDWKFEGKGMGLLRWWEMAGGSNGRNWESSGERMSGTLGRNFCGGRDGRSVVADWMSGIGKRFGGADGRNVVAEWMGGVWWEIG